MKSKVLTILLSISIMLLLVGCTKQEESAAVEAEPQKSSGAVAVDGAKLNYVIEGSGIPCLVIGSSTYYPRTFSQELRKHFKFIFVDLRHYVPLDETFEIKKITLDTYSDDVEKVRKALGLNNICILGHSIHALLAFEYAYKYPEHTSHVIMIGIYPCGADKGSKASDEFWEMDASDERKMMLKKNWENITEEAMKKLSPSEAFIKRYITDGPYYWHDPTYDCSWLWEGIELNMNVINHLFGVIFKQFDFTAKLHEINSPVFLALGRYDYVVPYTLWDDLKDKMPNLSYNLFEKSGHTPQLEEQSLFDQKLIDWIKSH